MVTEFLEAGWKAYKKNLGTILIANIIMFAVIILIAVLTIGPVFTAFPGATSLDIMALARNFFLAMLVIFVVAVELGSGLTGVYAQALKGKAQFGTLVSTIRKRWLSILGASAAIGAAALIGFGIALGIFLAMPGVVGIVLAAVVAILVIFVVLLRLALAEVAVVVGGLPAVKALETSWNIVGKNYLEFLGLVVIIWVLSMIVSIVPVIGSLINIFVVTPVTSMAIVQFYLKKKRR